MRSIFIIILALGLFCMTSSAMVLHGMSIYDGKLSNSGHSWMGYGKDKTCRDGPFFLNFKVDSLQGGFQANINMIQNKRYAIGFINLQNGSLSIYLFKEHEDQTKDFLEERLFPLTYYPTSAAYMENLPSTAAELLVRIENDQGHIQVFVSRPDQEILRPLIDYIDDDPLPPGNIDFETLENSSAHLSEVVTSCSSPMEESNYMGATHFKEPDLSYLINATSATDYPISVHWGEVPANQIMVVISDTIRFEEARGLAEQLASRLGAATDQEVHVIGEMEYINLFQIETESRSLEELIRDISFAKTFSPLVIDVFPNQQIYSENSQSLNSVYSDEIGEDYRILEVEEAWNKINDLKGQPPSKVTVGVIDDGVYKRDGQFDNVDLNTSIKIYGPLSPPSVLSSPKEGSLSVAGSHGTGICNLLAANGGELQGIASCLPKDKLKIFMINIGEKSFVTSSMLAFQFEIQNGSSIISCSMGKTDDGDPGAARMYDKFFAKLSEDPRFQKVLFIFSAGNEGKKVDGKNRIPNGLPVNKTLPNVITVGNVMNDGKIADKQAVSGNDQWTASACNRVSKNYDITLAAPGEQALWGLNNYRTNPRIMNKWGGTSMATPQVTAAAILIRSIDPCLTAGQIKNRLIETASDGPPELGGGILAIDKAVEKTISQRSHGFCNQFGPGVDIDLPGNYNKYDNIWGIVDIASNIEICNAVYTNSNRRIISCQKGNVLLVYNRVYLSGSALADVKKVTYYLHESFPNPVQISTDSGNDFEIWIMAWGSFVLRAEIEMKSGETIEKEYNFSFRSKVEEAQSIGIPMVLVPCDADLSQWTGELSNGAQPPSGTKAPSGFDTIINIVSEQYRGYTISVDGQQIGVEGQGGDALDGRYTFRVEGNQQHLIRIDHPMNWAWWQYFYNAGDSITYEF
jgi:hypothetical protein